MRSILKRECPLFLKNEKYRKNLIYKIFNNLRILCIFWLFFQPHQNKIWTLITSGTRRPKIGLITLKYASGEVKVFACGFPMLLLFMTANPASIAARREVESAILWALLETPLEWRVIVPISCVILLVIQNSAGKYWRTLGALPSESFSLLWQLCYCSMRNSVRTSLLV